MSFLKKIRQIIRKDDEPEYEFEEWNEVVYDRDDLQIHDREQRQGYVKNCLEQIVEATREVDNLQFEYNMVTSYLKDMEEIEALPLEERQELEEAAGKLDQLEEQKTGYLKRSNRMSDAQYHKMEALAPEVQEGYAKLKKAEDYQILVKADMKKLDNEKQAYVFRKHELQRMIEDLKGMVVICITVVALLAVLLMILQFGFKFNVQVGYLLTIAVAAGSITFIFVKHNDSMRELKRVEKSINKIILLHNTVKIRYVNNTNLLEYLQIKYEVANSAELNKMWNRYQEEKTERDTYRLAEQELDIRQKDLLHILRRYQVKDPSIWLHQTAAILDKKEMVEIRHNLIIRRQSLRRRIDYNKEVVAHKAQEEIKDLVEKYPQYAREILDTVAKYERKFN